MFRTDKWLAEVIMKLDSGSRTNATVNGLVSEEFVVNVGVHQ